MKKKSKYIPGIAKKSLNEDRLAEIEQDKAITLEDEDQEITRDIEPLPNGPLTADFIKLQNISLPSLPPDPSITNWMAHLGISQLTKTQRLIKNPYYDRPRSYRHRSQTTKIDKTRAGNERVKTEIEKQALKEQEKMINNSLIKPLSNKGIKVINSKTVYYH